MEVKHFLAYYGFAINVIKLVQFCTFTYAKTKFNQNDLYESFK